MFKKKSFGNGTDKRRVTLQSLFACGEIAMPKMLNDEAVEYEDGTPATEAQVGFLLLITDLRDFIELIVY